MQIIVTVEGRPYVVDREALMRWLQANAKTLADSNVYREVSGQDKEGRVVLNG